VKNSTENQVVSYHIRIIVYISASKLFANMIYRGSIFNIIR
jgi:hypothetical protein